MQLLHASRRYVPIAAALAIVTLTSGCGSSGKESASPSERAAYANGLCGAVATWQNSMQSVALSLRDVDELSQPALALEEVASTISAANTKLSDDVKALGDPPETGGDEAKAAVDDLSSKLETSVDKINTAAKNVSDEQSGVKAVNVVSAELLEMSRDIATTITQLKSIGAAAEWKKAFAASEACEFLG
jgi:uncharacterized phage infection (PIP) family protein YhgE